MSPTIWCIHCSPIEKPLFISFLCKKPFHVHSNVSSSFYFGYHTHMFFIIPTKVTVSGSPMHLGPPPPANKSSSYFLSTAIGFACFWYLNLILNDIQAQAAHLMRIWRWFQDRILNIVAQLIEQEQEQTLNEQTASSITQGNNILLLLFFKWANPSHFVIYFCPFKHTLQFLQ